MKTIGQRLRLEMPVSFGCLQDHRGNSLEDVLLNVFRCQLPNVDVETGTKHKDLPYKALVYSPLFMYSS